MGNCVNTKQVTVAKGVYSYKLVIQTSIWNKNQHNLFDFESPQLEKNNTEIEQSSKLIQVDNSIFPIGLNEKIDLQKILFKVLFENEKIIIKQPVQLLESKKDEKNNKSALQDNNKTTQEVQQQQQQDNKKDKNKKLEDSHQLWKVIRDVSKSDSQVQQDSTAKLQVGDMIKLGRANLIIKEFVLKDENDEADNNPPHTEDGYMENSQSGGDSQKHSCRICLSKGSTIDNPLICPCQCTGSVKYIHLKCIQKWVEKQFKLKKFKTMTVYFWKKLKCELCKESYKTDFVFQDRVYNIINIPKPQGSYLMLQQTLPEKKQDRGIFVINIQKNKQIKIGRTQECDLKLNDISVSRTHAILCVQDNQLHIQDCGSKFGTLLMLRGDLNLNPKEKKKYQLQSGRTLVSIEFQKKKKSQSQSSNKINEKFVLKEMSQEEINYEKQKEIEIEKLYQQQQLRPPQQPIFDSQEDLMIKEKQLEQQKQIQQKIFKDKNGKQGIELDDIIIYDIDDKDIKQYPIEQQIPQSNNVLVSLNNDLD